MYINVNSIVTEFLQEFGKKIANELECTSGGVEFYDNAGGDGFYVNIIGMNLTIEIYIEKRANLTRFYPRFKITHNKRRILTVGGIKIVKEEELQDEIKLLTKSIEKRKERIIQAVWDDMFPMKH